MIADMAENVTSGTTPSGAFGPGGICRWLLSGILAGLVLPVSATGQVPDPPTPVVVESNHSSEARRSDEGALFLLLPSGAQGVGLGRAMTALSSSESAFWNPAGLADLTSSKVLLLRGEHVAGDATGFSAILSGGESGALGISYQLLDVGTQTVTDDNQDPLGTITIRSHQALLSGALPLGSRLRIGANVKLLQSSVSCRGQCIDPEVSATTYAMDIGLQGRPLADYPLQMGLMLAHVGPRFQVDNAEQADPLPSRMRIGAAYDVLDQLFEEELTLNVVMEVEDRLRDPGNLSVYFGSELLAGGADQIFLRGGYVLGNRNQTDGAAVGFGVRYERFEFGIARSLARGGPSSEEGPVHVSLGVAL